MIIYQEIFVCEKFRQKRPLGSLSGIYFRQTPVVARLLFRRRSFLSFIFTFMNISGPKFVVL